MMNKRRTNDEQPESETTGVSVDGDAMEIYYHRSTDSMRISFPERVSECLGVIDLIEECEGETRDTRINMFWGTNAEHGSDELCAIRIAGVSKMRAVVE